MGLKDLKRRLTATTEELHQDRLREHFAEHESTPIGEAPKRTLVRLAGEVSGIQVVPRAGSPSLEVTIADGTGRAVLVFTGRRSLGGVGPGRRLVADGVGRDERNRLVLVNPQYTLLP
jgi:hypothetical protein